MVLEWLKGATGVFSAGDRSTSTTRATYPSRTSSRSRVRRRRPRSSSARATSTIPRRFLTRNSKSSCTRPAREACNFRSLLDSDPAGTYPGPLCRFGEGMCSRKGRSPFLITSKQHLFKSNRGVGGRRRRRIGNRKSLLGAVAVRVRCDVAHQAALERRPPRHPSSPLHAATAASAKDASRDRRLAQPPRTCPDSDACSSRASATVTGLN